MNRSSAVAAVIAILAGDVLLVGIYVVCTQTGTYPWLLWPLFDLDAEANIPAWYTAAQLLLTGGLFLMATLSAAGDELVPRWFTLLLGIGFTFLSADEIVGFHETLTVALRQYDFLPRFSGGHGVWIPIYVVACAGIATITLPAWLRLWRGERRGTAILCAGAVVFLTGAVVLEIVSYGDIRAAGPLSRLYRLEVAAEEGLEMIGASIMLFGGAVIAEKLNSPTVVVRG